MINGLLSGAVYALLALGFTLIYGVSGVVNLAHGAFLMIGAYMFSLFSSFLFSVLGPLDVMPILIIILAFVMAAAFVGAIGSIVYRLIVHPILGDDVGIMVVTISLALIFQQLVLLLWGYTIPVPLFVQGYTLIWGVRVTYIELIVSAISLGLFGILWLVVTKSKIGKAMRAVSQDHEAAMLMGISTERLYMLTMGVSTALAALAGIFFSSAYLAGQASAHMWYSPLFISFAIVVLGGLGSIKGTLLGGFIIAYSVHSVSSLIPEGGQLISAVPVVVMVLILLTRPKGLFGKRIEME